MVLPRSFRLAISAVCVLAVVSLPACKIPPPDPPPASCTLTPTNGLQRVSIGSRSYLEYVPAGIDATIGTGAPLLVSLHGLNSNAQQMSGYTGWQADADARGYIVVYPDSTDGSWEINDDSADVAFIRQVIANVSATYCVDAARVYVTGHSLGAYMAQRMACDASDVVAAVTEYAGGPTSLFGFGCDLARPVAIGLYHGENDRIVVNALGQVSRNQWIERDGCDPQPESIPTGDGTYFRYEPCSGGVTVTWRSYPNQGHLWPIGARNEAMQDLMWQLFDANPLPS